MSSSWICHRCRFNSHITVHFIVVKGPDNRIQLLLVLLEPSACLLTNFTVFNLPLFYFIHLLGFLWSNCVPGGILQNMLECRHSRFRLDFALQKWLNFMSASFRIICAPFWHFGTYLLHFIFGYILIARQLKWQLARRQIRHPSQNGSTEPLWSALLKICNRFSFWCVCSFCLHWGHFAIPWFCVPAFVGWLNGKELGVVDGSEVALYSLLILPLFFAVSFFFVCFVSSCTFLSQYRKEQSHSSVTPWSDWMPACCQYQWTSTDVITRSGFAAFL